MRITKWHIIITTGITIFCLAFTKSTTPAQRVAVYYDRQLDSLLASLRRFRIVANTTTNKTALTSSFLRCRNDYKKTELFIDVFDPYKARVLNGPDLIKIEDDNPDDSLMPHGLQVIEGIVYADNIDKTRLELELSLLIDNIEHFRKDPDRVYYFKDDKIWQAMRTGVYRIVSLGVTGFDVPFSEHSLPETRAVLSSVQYIARLYRKDINDTLFKRGMLLFSKADLYLATHNNFNTFDRLVFIREHINKISAWLTVCAQRSGYINHNERSALNSDAKYLFAPDIIDLAYFSPNENFRITQQRIALGKQLFYDVRLSGNNTRSCGSCHQPQKGFTDGLPKPTDLSGDKQLQRNTPTLWNTALQTRQFYDSRTETLENQLSAVVHNIDEMNGSLQNSVPRLLADTEYVQAFRMAYPGQGEFISQYNIANAISSYVRSLISLNSRFDRYMRGITDTFSADEKTGFNLFMGKAKCGTCHYAPVFNGLTPPLYQETESEVLAVPATNASKSVIDTDPGKYSFTKVALHTFAFKTPTIRNIALTAPYMHNGVFNTLDEVLDFYNDGGGAGRGISLPGQTLPAEKLNLTKKEMKQIIAFMHTLIDTSGSSFAYYKVQ